MPKLPKISPRLAGQWAVAIAVGAVMAAELAYALSQYTSYPPATVRTSALNVASLFVAYLLLAGVGGRKQKGKR